MDHKYEDSDYNKYAQLTDLNILIITATDLETKTLHENLGCFGNNTSIIRVVERGCYYYIGSFGQYNIVHVQSPKMGSVNCSNTVRSALEHWSGIRVTFMIGICFGIDRTKQRIGDIIVSENIIPYEIKRISKNEDIPRGTHIPANEFLVNAFKSQRITWKNENGKLNIGLVLSGEKLVDNIEFRNALLKEHPTSLGGEMEGAGLAEACSKKQIPWILVKSICDFADGDKGTNKDENQIKAINTAVLCCKITFENQYVFKDFQIKRKDKTNIPTEVEFIETSKIKDVLFDFYNIDREEFYINREIDKKVSSAVNFYGIWMYGKSGLGKTACLQRNLIIANKKFLFLNLAHCLNISVDLLFDEIKSELESKFDLPSSEKRNSFGATIKEIIEIIKNNIEVDDFYLFLEEVPLADNEIYKEFVPKLLALIIKIATDDTNIKLKFIISSLESPIPYILDTQHKIYEYIRFKEMSIWDNKDSLDLIGLIERSLSLSLEDETRNYIVRKTNGSPRTLKTFFRNCFAKEIKVFNDLKVITPIMEDTIRDTQLR